MVPRVVLRERHDVPLGVGHAADPRARVDDQRPLHAQEAPVAPRADAELVEGAVVHELAERQALEHVHLQDGHGPRGVVPPPRGPVSHEQRADVVADDVVDASELQT